MAVSIGVDVGGTKVLAVAVDPDDPGAVLASSRVPTPADTDGLVAAVIRAARAVADDPALTGRPPDAIGIGLPGLVDDGGVLRAAPNLANGVDADLRGPTEAALGAPVVVDNDANCAAWAEVVAGAARGAREVVMVTLGTGIGGGLVVGGRLHHGHHGFSGEPGHMVVDPSGPRCPCGRRGCWERFASGSGLEHLARDAVARGAAPGLATGGEGPTGEAVAAAARAGDAGALAVFDTFAGWLALGLSNLIDLLDPEVLVIGGGLAEVSDLWLDQARRRAVGAAMGSAARPAARIEVAVLGERAGAIGAALIAAGATPLQRPV